MSRVNAGVVSCVLLTAAAGCTEVAPVPSAASVPSSSLQTPTSAAPADSFTLIAGGDVLIHPALTEQATEDGNGKRDYAPLFAGIKPVLEQADLALCHLEVPIATAKGPFKGYPTFYAPPEVATGLADSGFDVCSTASNHTMDQGAEGVANTLDALGDAKIQHTGSARSAAEAAKPLVRDVAGVKVGFVSYTFAFNKGTSRPTPWMANLLDPAAVIAEAKRARDAGAEVVVASIHWGIEGKHEPTADQRKIAQRLLGDPSIDVIIGHHAHVVQPFERINGKWVTYGLGNQVAKHEEPKGTTEEGVLARFRFVKSGQGWTVDKAEYLPTLVDLGPPIRLRDLTSDTEVSAARKEQALKRTDGVVLSRDAATDGLARPGG
ncbi:CapA family protein [Actinokineospora sp.]|uniref:CapA family protein n=1 Tax=Actinokineospora sp. TaxID=1872133 RepID=UPI003D6A44D4